MRNAILMGLILLLATAGCITVDMGGGSSSKVPAVVKFVVSGYPCMGGGKRLIHQHRPGHSVRPFHRRG